MSNEQLIKKEPPSVEFVPYGSQDKIKMTVAIIQNLIAVKTKSGQTCSERDAIKFMAMCQAKRINPFEGDCFLIGYDTRDGASFALVTAHQTYLKRAELHPEFDGMKSGVIVRDDGSLKELEGDFFDEGQVVVGGWATVFFKNRKQPMHKRLRLDRFQKPFGVWQEDPAGMICKCAEADALRSSFPTMLGGLYLREEIEVEPLKEFRKPIFHEIPANGGSHPENPKLGAGDQGKGDTGNGGQSATGESVPASPPAGVTTGPSSPPPTQQQPEEQPAEGGGYNPLKGIRGLCKMANVKEGQLMTYLHSIGSTDGSFASLEELHMAKPELLVLIAEQWQNHVSKIKGK